MKECLQKGAEYAQKSKFLRLSHAHKQFLAFTAALKPRFFAVQTILTFLLKNQKKTLISSPVIFGVSGVIALLKAILYTETNLLIYIIFFHISMVQHLKNLLKVLSILNKQIVGYMEQLAVTITA